MNRRNFLLAFNAGAAALLSSCGYHVGGRADLVPKSIQTIAIPAFANSSVKYRLSDELPRDIEREFLARTRFKIEQDPGLADAVLNGTINSVFTFPTIYDPVSGKASSLQIAVQMSITLLERSSGRVLYANSNFQAKQGFDIPASTIVNPAQSSNGASVNNQVSAHQFFDESGPAYDRLGRAVARQVVTAVVENF